MINKIWLIILYLSFSSVTFGKDAKNISTSTIVIPDGIYILSQPYYFQLDTRLNYSVMFNGKDIHLSDKNEFLINSSDYKGDLSIYALDGNKKQLVLEKRMRFFAPEVTVKCCGVNVGDTITIKSLRYANIALFLMNYDLNVNFIANKVNAKVISYTGVSKLFEFEGFAFPQDLLEYMKNVTKGILVFDVNYKMGNRVNEEFAKMYYFDLDAD